MTQQFFGLLTKIGENKQAAAQALNRLVQITEMAVGDGGGTLPIPNREQVALINQKRRAPLNSLKQDDENPNYLIAEQVIPEDAGGWYIREIGLYDADGDLVAVANCPETYKPVLAEGSAREQVVRLVLMVASTSAFVLKIDPAVVLATRKYVDDKWNRNISISGGATADAVAMSGTGDIVVVVKGLDMSKATAGTLAVARGGTGLASVPAGSYMRGAGTSALEARTPSQVYADLGIAAAISAAIAAVVASSPATLDTLNELAQALGDDPNFATTMTNALAGKVDVATLANYAQKQSSVLDATAGRGLIVGAFGLGSTTTTATILDMDDITVPSGLYYVSNGSTLNNWLGASGFCLHKIYAAGGFQLGQNINTNKLQFRVRNSGGWQAPITLANLDSPAFTGAPTAPTPAATDSSTRLATTAFVAGNFPRVFSITALPGLDIGPIIVAECAEVWTWANTTYFTGYRSPLCGRPVDGHTVSPLASEVDAVGGLLSKTAYARLWGYARENGLTVTQTVWTANLGAHYFVDVDANNFRVPDLRNMFRRYTGTDADTANARTLGSRQSDAFQAHRVGSIQISSGGAQPINKISSTIVNQGGSSLSDPLVGNYAQVISDGLHGEPRTGYETRPGNAAFAPRIHV